VTLGRLQNSVRHEHTPANAHFLEHDRSQLSDRLDGSLRTSLPDVRRRPLDSLAPGLMCPLQTLEKLIDKCRLFPQTVLFSGFNDGASLDSLHGFSVPLE
jgi:hypothetical protein